MTESTDPYRPPVHAEPGREQASTDPFLRRVWVLAGVFVGMSLLLPVGLALQGARPRLFSVEMLQPLMGALLALQIVLGRFRAWRLDVEEAPREELGGVRVPVPRGWRWEGWREQGVARGLLHGPGLALELVHDASEEPSDPPAASFEQLSESYTLRDRRPRSLRLAGAPLAGESVTYLQGWVPVVAVRVGGLVARGRLTLELTYQPLFVPWTLVERLLDGLEAGEPA